MKKKEGITIKINLSNRWLYTFILLGILIAVGVGVYALTPGVKPNPGHLLNETAPPSPCTANQFLKWDGSNWICSTASCSVSLTSCQNVYGEGGGICSNNQVSAGSGYSGYRPYEKCCSISITCS